MRLCGTSKFLAAREGEEIKVTHILERIF